MFFHIKKQRKNTHPYNYQDLFILNLIMDIYIWIQLIIIFTDQYIICNIFAVLNRETNVLKKKKLNFVENISVVFLQTCDFQNRTKTKYFGKRTKIC